jgi:pimeloyl-ACP methyl ester carboxylesterase
VLAADRIAQARARLDAILARERADTRIAHRTRWWVADHVAPTAVVLLHGLTNSPPQYDALAPLLHARGHAVIVPRFPMHGYRDRMTDALAALRATDLEATALEAVAIAALCGQRVVVMGISIGATLAGWLAARTRIDTGIAFAPFCGLRELYGGVNDALGAVLRTLPNAFGWWDPRVKEKQPPSHGYPRFATRALGESLRLSTDIGRAPRGSAPHGRRAVLVLHTNDPVVNNAHAHRRFATLREFGVDYQRVVLQGLPEMHDVIEPLPQAHTDLVYPALIDLIET